jgi:hypothetical protein
MSKAKERICSSCGKIEVTASYSKVCANCYVKNKVLTKRQIEKEFIEGLGYSNISNTGTNEHGKPMWKFTHDCGTEQTWTFNNLFSRAKANGGIPPCQKCGGYRRMMNAHAGYMKKHARKYDLKLYEDYRAKVRFITEKTYNQNKHIINPLNLPRGLGNINYHLDHKVPIIACFLENISPENAASLINLQMMDAKLNLTKSKYDFNFDLLEQLKML